MKIEEWKLDLESLKLDAKTTKTLFELAQNHEMDLLLSQMKQVRKEQLQSLRACSCMIDLCDDLILEIKKEMHEERKASWNTKKN